MSIYTKQGDKGKTRLFDKQATWKGRVYKDSPTTRTIGVIDELNSYLGVICSFCEDRKVLSQLEGIQKDLLIIGSILAGSNLRFFKTKT